MTSSLAVQVFQPRWTENVHSGAHRLASMCCGLFSGYTNNTKSWDMRPCVQRQNHEFIILAIWDTKRRNRQVATHNSNISMVCGTYLSIYLSNYLSIDLSIYLSIYLYIYTPIVFMRFKHNWGVPTLWGSMHTYPSDAWVPQAAATTMSSWEPWLLPTRTSGSGVSADFWR